MPPVAVFRFDASPKIGAGHAMRSLVLAEALTGKGWTTVLAVSEECLRTVPRCQDLGYPILLLSATAEDAAAFDPQTLQAAWPDRCDLLVIDHYDLDSTYEAPLRGWARKILIIDDLANRSHDADYLLDQTADRQPSDYQGLHPPQTVFFLGSPFALIRQGFSRMREAALARRRRTGLPQRALVSFGYTDPSNATQLALDGLAQSGLEITVAIGKAAPHLSSVQETIDRLGATLRLDVSDMEQAMLEADLAVGAAGSTSWERACLGLPSIVMITGSDQQLVARALGRHGAAINLGLQSEIRPDHIRQATQSLRQEGWAQMSDRAAALCDGQGASRIAAAIDLDTRQSHG